MRYGGLILSTWLWACGAGAPSTSPGSSGDSTTTPSSAGTTVTRTQAGEVRVELRGLDHLDFPNGARVHIERFVVSLGGVSLLEDLSDPGGSRVDLISEARPVVINPGQSTNDHFDGSPNGSGAPYNGVRIDLSPGRPAPSSSATPDQSGNTIFVRGVYSTPAPTRKGDENSISPNPAPIHPGSSQQGLTATVTVPFTFASRATEDLLVGVSGNGGLDHDVTVVFPVNRWFTDGVRGYFEREAADRVRLGIPSDTPVHLGGEGIAASDDDARVAGSTLEQTILQSIGVEVR